MGKLFTVIMPCYNMEMYVDRAIQSVMDQSLDLSKVELITVNDASTDDTLKHLNDWADRFPDTVKVITYDTNLRQGGARNLAIKEASGEYVCFLDADDWLERDALKAYEYGINETGADIVSAKSEESYEYHLFGEEKDSYDISLIKCDTGKGDILAADLGYVCTAVYRREMITGNSVWFPEHMAYEDIYWQRIIKFYAESAAVIDHVTLHHFIHEQSTINKKNAPHQLDRLTSYEMYLRECRSKGFLEEYRVQIMNDAMETYFFNSYYVFFLKMDEIPDIYSRVRNTIYTYFPDWEEAYDDRDLPVVFQYMCKLLKKAYKASPADLQPFKDTILELVEE